MRFLKICCVATVALLLAVLFAMGVGAAEADGGVSFLDGETVVASADSAVAGEITVPAHTPLSGHLLVGWRATVGGEVCFLPVGAIYRFAAGENTVFAPVTVDMTTSGTVTPRFDDGGAGLRFTTAVDLASFEALLALCPTLERGTLIVPQRYVTDIGGLLTHEKLQAASKQYLDIVTEGWYAEGEGESVFAGSVSHIRFENYTLPYSAVGYIKVNYTDGGSAYIYAKTSTGSVLSVSPWQMAYEALTDVQETEDTVYQYVSESGYSPYSDTERETLRTYPRAVIAFVVDESVPGGRSLDHSMEAIGQRAYAQIVIKEGDERWTHILPFVGIKATGALMVTPTDGGTLTATEIAGAVLNFTRIKGLAMPYVLGDNCILIAYSDYTENH